MKVLWLTNIPSPYRVKFFNELGKHCDLTVLFEVNSSKDRDSSWASFNKESFTPVFLMGKRIGASNAICPGVVKYLNKSFDHIVITNFSSPTGIIAISFLRMMRISFEIESDGGFPGSGKGVKEQVKRFILKGADRYFSTAKSHDCYYLKYGVKKEKIVRYPFTSIGESEILDVPVDKSVKEELKKKLGISESIIILGVGQFINRKGFDVLLSCYDYLPEEVGIYLIGGTPTPEYLKIANGKRRVHFIQFKLKDELAEYYKAADIFVLPTREDIWGLVINEAMAYGLPVVTTTRCVAGLELIKNGKNGFLVKPDDIKELSESIVRVINMNKSDSLSQNSLRIIKEYTIEKMAQCHVEIWRSRREDV